MDITLNVVKLTDMRGKGWGEMEEKKSEREREGNVEGMFDAHTYCAHLSRLR